MHLALIRVVADPFVEICGEKGTRCLVNINDWSTRSSRRSPSSKESRTHDEDHHKLTLRAWATGVTTGIVADDKVEAVRLTEYLDGEQRYDRL
jgi:hypothetical protein